MNQKLIAAILLGSLLLVGIARAEEPIAGIGVALGVKADTLVIMKVLPGTPAERARLSPGWIVHRIDNIATAGKPLVESVTLLRGPAGSKVKLELIDAASNKTNTVELIRERVL